MFQWMVKTLLTKSSAFEPLERYALIESFAIHFRNLFEFFNNPKPRPTDVVAAMVPPGQSGSYFYGYSNLLALRKETEGALGRQFNQKKFHDFILSQGLLPPDLMHKAVIIGFVERDRRHAATP